MGNFSAKWLFRVRNCASEFLPQENLRCLQAFVASLENRLVQLGVVSKGECVPPREFSTWISHHFAVRGEFNAYTLVQIVCENDSTAYRQFFRLLEEFSNRKEVLHSRRLQRRFKGMKALLIDRTDWLQEVYKRPSLYLGEKSLTALYSSFQGDRYAADLVGLTVREVPSISSIEATIAKDFGYRKAFNARQILLVHSGYDEGIAFEKFFEYLRGYCSL